MTTYLADLHTHTDISNGSFGIDLHVDAIIRRADELGGKVFVLSMPEHNTIEGQDQLREKVTGSGINYLSGIEVSTIDGIQKPHILGYGIDTDQLAQNVEYSAFLDQIRGSRNAKAEDLCEKICSDPLIFKGTSAEYPISVTYDELTSGRKTPTLEGIGRVFADKINAHLRAESEEYQLNMYQAWRIFMRRKMDEHSAIWGIIGKYFPDISPDNESWNVEGQLVYMPTEDAIEMIHELGGVAVLAHPGKDGFKKNDIERFSAEYQLDAVEVFSTNHRKNDVSRLYTAATNAGLLVTGGSNWHGPGYTEAINAFDARTPEFGHPKPQYIRLIPQLMIDFLQDERIQAQLSTIPIDKVLP